MKRQEIVNVIIENPKGSCNVYKQDEELAQFYLARVMPKGLSFPFDFGYIVDTDGGDGNELLAIVIGDCHTFVSCKISCRVVGGILSTLTEEDGSSLELQHFLVLPLVDGVQQIKNLTELPAIVLENLKSFLINDFATAGKKLRFTGKLSNTEAIKIIKKANKEQEFKYQLELVLPQTDAQGKPFAEALFDELNRELIKKFSGLTVYARLPADGFWKNDSTTVQQSVVVYQLMLPDLDFNYWKQLKANLENKFNQTEVLITYGPSKKIK